MDDYRLCHFISESCRFPHNKCGNGHGFLDCVLENLTFKWYCADWIIMFTASESVASFIGFLNVLQSNTRRRNDAVRRNLLVFIHFTVRENVPLTLCRCRSSFSDVYLFVCVAWFSYYRQFAVLLTLSLLHFEGINLPAGHLCRMIGCIRALQTHTGYCFHFPFMKSRHAPSFVCVYLMKRCITLVHSCKYKNPAVVRNLNIYIVISVEVVLLCAGWAAEPH